jgi:hypothetical protein
LADKEVDWSRQAEAEPCPYCADAHKAADGKPSGYKSALPFHKTSWLVAENKKRDATFDQRQVQDEGAAKRRRLHETTLLQIRVCGSYRTHCHGQGKNQASCLECQEKGSLMVPDPAGRPGDMICGRHCCGGCNCTKKYYEKDAADISRQLHLEKEGAAGREESVLEVLAAAQESGRQRERSKHPIAQGMVHDGHALAHLTPRVSEWGPSQPPTPTPQQLTTHPTPPHSSASGVRVCSHGAPAQGLD